MTTYYYLIGLFYTSYWSIALSFALMCGFAQTDVQDFKFLFYWTKQSSAYRKFAGNRNFNTSNSWSFETSDNLSVLFIYQNHLKWWQLDKASTTLHKYKRTTRLQMMRNTKQSNWRNTNLFILTYPEHTFPTEELRLVFRISPQFICQPLFTYPCFLNTCHSFKVASKFFLFSD